MTAGAAVRIVLIDDHAVVRAGYRRFLEQESGYEVIAEAGSGEEAYQLLQRVSPDIVILDLSMPGEGGLSALRRYKLRWPLLPVLVFSMHDHLASRSRRCAPALTATSPRAATRSSWSGPSGACGRRGGARARTWPHAWDVPALRYRPSLCSGCRCVSSTSFG